MIEAGLIILSIYVLGLSSLLYAVLCAVVGDDETEARK